MIISHTHQFIFIKSAKTAGTSIEAALSNSCIENDIVTPLYDYKFNRDENGQWIHHAHNHTPSSTAARTTVPISTSQPAV